MRTGVLIGFALLLTLLVAVPAAAEPVFSPSIDPLDPTEDDNVTISLGIQGLDDILNVTVSLEYFGKTRGPFDAMPAGQDHAYEAGYLPNAGIKALFNITYNETNTTKHITTSFPFTVSPSPTIVVEMTTDPVNPTNKDEAEFIVSVDGVDKVISGTLEILKDGRVKDTYLLNITGLVGDVVADMLSPGKYTARFTMVIEKEGETRERVHEETFNILEEEEEKTIPIDVVLLFTLMGLVIIVGFVGSFIFEKWGVPDVFSLIFLGIIIGKSGYALLETDLLDLLEDVAPLFAAIAMLIILFDGGLNLNLGMVIKESSRASIMAIFTFLITMVALGAFAAVVFFDMQILPGLMLGAALGGTSGAIVIPTVMKIKTKESTKILLSLESTITDVMCIVMAVAIAEILAPSAESLGAAGAVQSIIGAFAIGVFVGLVGGIFWLRIMPKLEKMPYGFMLTLAFAIVLYAFAQFAGGSGPVAALALGLVLANGPEVGRMFRYRERTKISNSMKQFHSEITFFVKSFFFVYTGLLFINPAWQIWAYGIALTVIILLVRWACISLTMKDRERQDRMLMWVLGPRGLSAAVLATLPVTYGFANKDILTGSQVELFQSISLIVIITTVLFTTVMIPVGRKRWTPERMALIEAKAAERKARREEKKVEKAIEAAIRDKEDDDRKELERQRKEADAKLSDVEKRKEKVKERIEELEKRKAELEKDLIEEDKRAEELRKTEEEKAEDVEGSAPQEKAEPEKEAAPDPEPTEEPAPDKEAPETGTPEGSSAEAVAPEEKPEEEDAPPEEEPAEEDADPKEKPAEKRTDEAPSEEPKPKRSRRKRRKKGK